MVEVFLDVFEHAQGGAFLVAALEEVHLRLPFEFRTCLELEFPCGRRVAAPPAAFHGGGEQGFLLDALGPGLLERVEVFRVAQRRQDHLVVDLLDLERSRRPILHLRPPEVVGAGENGGVNRLFEQLGLSLEAGLAAAIARAARGGLRDAESMLEQLMAASPGTTLTIADLDHLCGRAPAADVEALFAAVDAGDAGAALDAVGRSLSAGAQPGVLVDQWLDHLRSALADAARAGRPVARLAQSIEVVLGKRTHLRQGADGALVTEVTAIELARLPDARDVDALVAALAGRMEGARPREGATSPRASDDDADASGTSPARREPPVASRPLHEGSKVREAAPAPRARPDPAPTAPAPRVAPRKDAVDDVVAAVTDLDDVAQRWPRLVEALAAREARLAAVLRRARPVALRGDVLELEVDGGTFEARTALIQSRAQAAFGQVAPRVLGRRVRPVVRAGASMAPVAVVDAAVRELPIVRRVAEFTGGHLVHVERQAPDSAEGHGSAEQASGDDPA